MTKFDPIPPGYAKYSDGQSATPEQIARGQAMAARVLDGVDHIAEADAFAETLMEHVATDGAQRGLSPEQLVFAVAIATIHLRRTFPAGTQRFDEICREAQVHYDKDA
jgi:hypothetical protein